MFPDIHEQMDHIKSQAVDLLPEEDLLKKLERSRRTNTPLIIKLGCDPSRPDLHIGHSVVLRKMRQFQDLGHQAVLIVGDFTGMIGDPSGRNATRPALTLEQTRQNGQSYFEQAAKVLDASQAKIVYNSEWLGTMTFEDVIRLASKYTVARMLERDDFHNRFRNEEPISIHEFLYPLAQAMDSVAIRADVELGGTDQKFNLLLGRDIQREYGQEPQVILTMPILPGTDGVQKMSKSLGNYIGLTDTPAEMYGKTLSIPDTLLAPYVELLLDLPAPELAAVKSGLADGSRHPRDVKRWVARTLVSIYHSRDAAQQAEEAFDRIFVKKDLPTDMPEFTPETNDPDMWIVTLLTASGLASSNSDARRLIKEGAVSVNGEKITDSEMHLLLNNPAVLKVGKRRFIKLVPKGA